MNRRTALGAIIGGAGLGVWLGTRDEKTPEKPKIFPKTLEVQGMKIQLDASWNDYPAPEGKTVEGLFLAEFQNIHTFYQTYGINLTGKDFAFVYDPNMNDYGKTTYDMKNYSSGNVEHQEYDERGNMKSMQIFMRDVTRKPIPVHLKFLRGSSIAHEIFHNLHGPYFYSSVLWPEGIAEALESLYEKRFPGSEVVQSSNREVVESIGSKEALAKEFFSQPDIQNYLFGQGFDENWILQDPSQFPKYSSTLTRDVAGLRWESFLTKHPDFVAKLLAELEEITRLSREKTTGDKDFVVEENERALEAVGHRAAPEYFWDWMKNEKVFQRGRVGEKVMIGFLHRQTRRITVISAQWANETLTSSVFEGFSTTIARLSPRPFTMILKSGKEITLTSPTVFGGLSLEGTVRAEDIQSLRDFEGNEIRIVR